ncbi:MAG: hypothetical protein VYD90_12775 [Pseudomonadota bacterium]|nr:hypothetical protein [Pseudomonadota bacterium]
MSDEVSGKGGAPAWLPFDLLGHPVPANKGAKARPQHAPSAENLEKIIILLGMGRSEADCAAAIGLSVPTMKKHYFSHAEVRKAKRHAGLVLEAELLARLNEQSLAGKTSATEKLLKRLDKARLGPVPTAQTRASKRKGVKEERRDAAYDAGRGDDGWGPLLHGEIGRTLPN